MPNEIRIKRRVSGAAGAPAALKTAELAWNMADNIVYGGFGDSGSGDATSVVAVAGDGAFVDLTTGQTVAGLKTFSTLPQSAAAPTAANDLTTKSYVDTVASGGQMLTAGSGIDSTELTSNSSIVVDATIARLDSPAFVNVPTAPTATSGNSSTQLATTAFVSAAVSDLVAGAGPALDTLNELAAALGNDANFSTTITAQLGTKLTASADLSDLNDAATARGNLGLGDMSVQNASAVAITGGTIDGINLDGGTF